MNQGKRFESDFQKSVPNELLLYRLNDSAQSFSKSNILRFSPKSPFDYIMWNPDTKTLYALELKTVSGKSISFERSYKESGNIHYHQIEGLNHWNKYGGIICGFIIEFRASNQVIFLSINGFNTLVDFIDKKSFCVQDLIQHNIDYIIIPSKQIRTRFRYDIAPLVNANGF